MEIKLEEKKIKFVLITLFWGMILPIFLTHQNFKIYDSITKALELWDKEHLLIGMLKLVIMNTLRSIPMYIAIFLLFDSIEIIKNGKKRNFEKVLLILPIIPIAYSLIKIFYDIQLPVGKTSILGVLWFCYYVKFDLKNITYVEKYLVFLSFIVGLQWLDVSKFFNFLGVGEITSDLNKAISFMEADVIVTLICISFFSFFTLFSILLLHFFKGQEERIARSRSEMENRHLKEVQLLVHDLKTPIFSVGALLETLTLQEEDERKKLYLKKMEDSIEKTNIMISEILSVKSEKPIEIEEMMKFIFSFLSVHKNIEGITYKSYLKKDYKLKGNRILLSRVIINLIVNSWEANSSVVNIMVKDYKKRLIIQIDDYGDGIDIDNINELIKDGVSTKKSSGKGLSFVVKTIKDMDGKIYFIKKIKMGTKIYIILKGDEYGE
ncbi:MAG: ATP-binding protein [Sarcina sp.]